MYTVLSVLQVFICVILILLILLHSGKDAGMSGAFGVGVAGGSTGGSLMERNLDRWTILFAVLFAANTIVAAQALAQLCEHRVARRGGRARRTGPAAPATVAAPSGVVRRDGERPAGRDLRGRAEGGSRTRARARP